MKNYDEIAFKNAQLRVEKLKKFYSHLVTYIAVNSFISFLKIFSDVREGLPLSEALFSLDNYTIWIYWGIGIAIHAFSVFGLPLFIGKDWEERKIQQFMKEEEKKRRTK